MQRFSLTPPSIIQISNNGLFRPRYLFPAIAIVKKNDIMHALHMRR